MTWELLGIIVTPIIAILDVDEAGRFFPGDFPVIGLSSPLVADHRRMRGKSKDRRGMPIVFRHDGFRFFFYSNEGDPREPIHVHVRRGGGEAKFWAVPVSLASSDGFDARTLRELAKIVEDKAALIERAWHEHFS